MANFYGGRKFTAEEIAAKKLRRHEHLRQIKQSYVHRDAIHGPFVHPGDDLLAKFLELVPDKTTKLLVASDNRHLKKIEALGYTCVWQVDDPVDPDDIALGKISRKPSAAGLLQKFSFKSLGLGGAFVCSRLQKQPNVYDYLVALRSSVAPGSPIALIVPTAHHELVTDHVNLFTAGTLIYSMVRAGWDCSEASVTYDKRFINVLLRRKDLAEPFPRSVDDAGKFMPFKNVFNYCSSEFPQVYRTLVAPGKWS